MLPFPVRYSEVREVLEQLAARGEIEYLNMRGVVSYVRRKQAKSQEETTQPVLTLSNIVKVISEIINEKAQSAKGRLVTIKLRDIAKKFGVPAPKLNFTIKEIFEYLREQCPDCFYMFERKSSGYIIVLYRDKVSKILELLRHFT